MKEHWSIEDIKAAATGNLGRRTFMKGVAGLAAGVALAPLMSNRLFAAVGGELKILAWEGFTLEKELKGWRETSGVKVNAGIMSTQDDVHSRFVGGNPLPLDLAEYNQGYSELYGNDLKIMLPLDESKIPNYRQDSILEGFYRGDKWYWDGKLYGVPWIWGLNSLVYNPKQVPQIASYKDLLSPAFKGKLAFGDDTLATWPMIARVAGFGDKFPNLTAEELDAAFEAMNPYRDQCRVFAASNGDSINLLVSGEISALFCGWSGIPTETVKQGVLTKYAVPAEGAAMWCDAWFMPVSATNPDTAHAFINESISPKVQAEVCKSVIGGTVSKAAIDLMDAETRSYFDYTNLAEVLKKSPLQGIPPFSSDKYATFDMWVQKWTDFKSGF
ncbi:extracellular solute-binding protein [Pseudomonas sp. MOB-449]|nr:extracellular solute-binding protein [Pseudomonas sp. MOB-449]